MIIRTINHEQIAPSDKCIEVSIFDKRRGIMLKHEFSIDEKLYIDLFHCKFFTMQNICEYPNFTIDEDKIDVHLYGDLVKNNCDALDAYILEKNDEILRPYHNKKILDEVQKKEDEIAELKKQLK